MADIKADMANKVVNGRSFFYTASTGRTAKQHAKDHGLKKLQEDIDTDRHYNDISKWKDWDEVSKNWSQAKPSCLLERSRSCLRT